MSFRFVNWYWSGWTVQVKIVKWYAWFWWYGKGFKKFDFRKL